MSSALSTGEHTIKPLVPQLNSTDHDDSVYQSTHLELIYNHRLCPNGIKGVDLCLTSTCVAGKSVVIE